MKTFACSSYLVLDLVVFFSLSLVVQAADPAPETKEQKVLPPIPIPIVPTRFVIPDENPSPPDSGNDKPGSKNKPFLTSPEVLNRIFNESEAAFAVKDYDKAASLIQDLLEKMESYPDGAPEILHYNLGLAKLLGGKAQEAEAAFKQCIKRYPKGSNTSRAYLGLGKSCMLQKTAEKKAEAIEAFKLAARDPKQKDEAEKLIKVALADTPSPVGQSDKK